MMSTFHAPLAPNAETDIDSPEIHNIPLTDLETGEITDPDDEEEEEEKRHG
jgi:hypothetical protein